MEKDTVILSIERYHELQEAEKNMIKLQREFEKKIKDAGGKTICIEPGTWIAGREKWIKTNDEAVKEISEMLKKSWGSWKNNKDYGKNK